MRGLRKNQELVEGIYTESGDQFQTNGQSDATQIIHRLVEREAARMTQRAVRTPQFVFDNIPGITKQDSSGFLFALDDVSNDPEQLIEKLFFRSPQCRLVRDLEVVADNLTS